MGITVVAAEQAIVALTCGLIYADALIGRCNREH
jgi:hypothetical protein